MNHPVLGMPYRRTAAVQARFDAQREAVLRAAVELLAGRSYAGCPMTAVAARAAVATGQPLPAARFYLWSQVEAATPARSP